MNAYQPRMRLQYSSLAMLVAVAVITGTAKADSISSLQQQQQALEQQAQQAQQQAQANETLAQRAADRIQQVNTQIDQVSDQITTTNQSISDTQNQIGQQDQLLQQDEDKLSQIQQQQNALIREMYMDQASYSPTLSLFSTADAATQDRVQEHLATVNKAVTELYAQTSEAKQQVTDARDQLVRKNDDLTAYKTQQQAQADTLADAKSTQVQLQENAEATEQQLETQAAQAQAQANQIAAKIRTLTATSNWGSQIVSEDSGGWYYSQTGDYTHLGGSSETVNNVGCLITSIAMVATYYGNRITPDYMATHASFSSGGEYYWGTPAGLDVSLQRAGGVNWGTVQQQVSEGHPVIVSIYLPSVGAVNSDGSSHYIVIKGVSDGKYLMQDPIGAGRSYNLNQVRSMILTSAD